MSIQKHYKVSCRWSDKLIKLQWDGVQIATQSEDTSGLSGRARRTCPCAGPLAQGPRRRRKGPSAKAQYDFHRAHPGGLPVVSRMSGYGDRRDKEAKRS